MSHDNITNVVEYLGLDIPFEIKMVSRKNKKASADYIALYKDGGKGKLHKHSIRVFLGNQKDPNERSIETLIVHELIHAWQEEMGYTDNHGESFRRMAKNIAVHFGIPDLYIPDLDKE